MYRLPRLRGLNLHYKPFATTFLSCRYSTAMAGNQSATASAGPAEVKPTENAMREVKILMLHGKIPSVKVAIVSFRRSRGSFLRTVSECFLHNL